MKKHPPGCAADCCVNDTWAAYGGRDGGYVQTLSGLWVGNTKTWQTSMETKINSLSGYSKLRWGDFRQDGGWLCYVMLENDSTGDIHLMEYDINADALTTVGTIARPLPSFDNDGAYGGAPTTSGQMPWGFRLTDDDKVIGHLPIHEDAGHRQLSTSFKCNLDGSGFSIADPGFNYVADPHEVEFDSSSYMTFASYNRLGDGLGLHGHDKTIEDGNNYSTVFEKFHQHDFLGLSQGASIDEVAFASLASGDKAQVGGFKTAHPLIDGIALSVPNHYSDHLSGSSIDSYYWNIYASDIWLGSQSWFAPPAITEMQGVLVAATDGTPLVTIPGSSAFPKVRAVYHDPYSGVLYLWGRYYDIAAGNTFCGCYVVDFGAGPPFEAVQYDEMPPVGCQHPGPFGPHYATIPQAILVPPPGL